MKRSHDLFCGAENVVQHLSQETNAKSQRQACKERPCQNKTGFWRGFVSRWRSPGDKSRFRRRQRLLLGQFGIPLKQIVVERVIGSSLAFELLQRALCLASRMGI